MAVYTISNLAERNRTLGDLDAAANGFRESIVRARRSHMMRTSLGNLLGTLVEQGKLEEATPVAHEALALLAEGSAWLFDDLGLFDALALRLALTGRDEDAARLNGFVNAMYETGSQRREHNEERLQARLLALLRERFCESELERLLREGTELDENEAYRIAL